MLWIVVLMLFLPACGKKWRNDNLPPGANVRQSLAADAAACKEQGNLLFPKLSRDEREPLDRGNGFETTVAYAEDWMMDNNLDAYVSRCLRDRGWEQK